MTRSGGGAKVLGCERLQPSPPIEPLFDHLAAAALSEFLLEQRDRTVARMSGATTTAACHGTVRAATSGMFWHREYAWCDSGAISFPADIISSP
jgi:hypothetical protein